MADTRDRPVEPVRRSVSLHRCQFTLHLFEMKHAQQHWRVLLCKTGTNEFQFMSGSLKLCFWKRTFKQSNVVEVEFFFTIDFELSVVMILEWLYEGVSGMEALLIGRVSAAHQLLQAMNFLNKKYTSLHASSPYAHSNSRSFLPSASTMRDNAPALAPANCDNHPSEVVRHLCLECVELLCAECIGEHLELHREANLIPKISSIKQMRAEMEGKLDHIADTIARNSPAQLDVDALRRRALERVDDMRRDLVKAVDQWIGIMRAHLLGSLGFDELARMRGEMEKLGEEVGVLRGALQGGAQPAAIKKVFQIDADKLEESYSAMFTRFKQLQKKADFEFAIDWKQIVKSFETHININPHNQILEQPEQPEWKPEREISREHSTSREESRKSERVYDLHRQ